MNLRLMAWIAAVTASAALTSNAHPGHGAFSKGAKHFLTSPSHVGVALLFAAGLFAGAQLLKGRAERAAVRSIAALIAIVAIVF
jgi:hypothetical protein